MAGPLNPPPRYLLGPGPAPVEPSVLAAMSGPPLAPEDPEARRMLRGIQDGLRKAFRSSHPTTIAFPGDRARAVDAALATLVDDGTPVVVAISGTGGEELAEAAGRLGGRVRPIPSEVGRSVDPERLGTEVGGERVVVAVCHVEPSTGVVQPLEGLRRAIGAEAFLMVDATYSLGGIPLEVDRWGIDLCVAAGHHCLGAPPGLGVLTAAIRTEAARLDQPPPSLDIELLARPWGDGHHGPDPAWGPLLHALREALRLLDREGLENRWKRHADVGVFLQEALIELGFDPVAAGGHRSPHLTVVRLPPEVDPDLAEVLLHDHDIVVGTGQGDLEEETWRIGLMGFGARREHALRLLQALRALFALPGGPGRARRS